MSQCLVVVGLVFDILGVLLLSAGFISGRKHRILNRIQSLKENAEFRQSSIDNYENLRKRFRQNYDEGIIDSDEKLLNAERTVDGWISDVNKSRDKVSKKISEEQEQLREELESYQLTKEAVGLVFLVVGFFLQILGTTSALH